MLFVGVCFSVIAQEPIITPIPTNTPVDSSSQSGIHLGMQTAENGKTYLNWTTVPLVEGSSPINSDIEWLVDGLNEGISSPPVMLPSAPLPQPSVESFKYRSFDIDMRSQYRHTIQVSGQPATYHTMSIPHTDKGTYCIFHMRTSFTVAEGYNADLFVSDSGRCSKCQKDRLTKSFSIKEGMYNLSVDRNNAYDATRRELRRKGIESEVLWQVKDKKGRALNYQPTGPYDSEKAEQDGGVTYKGGHYLRITPLTFPAWHESRINSPLFELLTSCKTIANAAYTGVVGDKITFYLRPYGLEGVENQVIEKEQPWYMSEGGGVYMEKVVATDAEIIEVIQGPMHMPDIYNSYNPDYWRLLIQNDYSAFQATHSYCGRIPIDYRAIILRLKQPGLSTRYLLGIKGTQLNRSDLSTDFIQFFGGIPEQYRFSLKVAEYVHQLAQADKSSGGTVIGHSLGGGMAQYVVGCSSFAGPWDGYGFNPATLGWGVSAEIVSKRDDWQLAYGSPVPRFTVIQNASDIVANAPGQLLGNIWMLESSGHKIASMDLSSIATVLPAPTKDVSLVFSADGAPSNATALSPPLLPGFVNQQFSNSINP